MEQRQTKSSPVSLRHQRIRWILIRNSSARHTCSTPPNPPPRWHRRRISERQWIWCVNFVSHMECWVTKPNLRTMLRSNSRIDHCSADPIGFDCASIRPSCNWLRRESYEFASHSCFSQPNHYMDSVLGIVCRRYYDLLLRCAATASRKSG